MLTIDIVSDAVCPWCFIGKRHLDTALAELRRRGRLESAEDVRLHWHPFLLDPHTPEHGDPYPDFLLRKFGAAERVQNVLERVRQAGHEAGIDFAFDKIALRPNTLRAHRLLHRSQMSGTTPPPPEHRYTLPHALAERLFAAHFLEGLDIGDIPTLATLAAPLLHVPSADLAVWLAGDQYAEAVLAQAERLPQMLGIGGVPFFIINGSTGLAGAQPPGAFIEAIEQTLAQPHNPAAALSEA